MVRPDHITTAPGKVVSLRDSISQLGGENGGALQAQAESERTVMGSMLIAPDVIHILAQQLKPKMFMLRQTKLIFEAALELAERGVTPDLALIIEDLRDTGRLDQAGGCEYLVRLIQAIPPMANLQAHIERLRSAHERRRLAKAMQKGIAAISEWDVEPRDVIGQIMAEAVALEQQGDSQGWDLSANATELFEEHASPSESQDHLTKTGFEAIDREIIGLPPGSFVVLGGHSGDGKSALGIAMARNMAESGRNVAFMGLEMPNSENFLRLVSMESGVPLNHLIERRTPSPDQADDLVSALNRIHGMPLRLLDQTTDLASILATARMLRHQGKLDVLFVDHLHIVQHPSEGHERDRRVIGSLRLLAKELGIVLVGMGQFRSGQDVREDQRPRANWLTGGKIMVRDPTHILLLYRPGLHQGDPSIPSSLAEVIVAKNRHGSPGKVVRLAMLEQCVRFTDWSSR